MINVSGFIIVYSQKMQSLYPETWNINPSEYQHIWQCENLTEQKLLHTKDQH